ncbi:MAG: tail fiber domain-containing protein [Bacteroidota bacterium]
MPLPASVVPKNPGDPILSENWNDLGAEVNRLDTDKANLNGAVFTGPLTISDEARVSNSATLNFGNQTRQMINLWNTGYGIGVQDSRLYFRTNDGFAFHRLGTHNDGMGIPGTGGSRLAAITGAGDLVLSARTNPNADPGLSLCRALVDFGNELIINFNGDFSQGVEVQSDLKVSSGNIGVRENNPTVPLHVNGGTGSSGMNANSGYLTLGSSGGVHLSMDNNEIQAKLNATTASTLYLNFSGGLVRVGGRGLVNVSNSSIFHVYGDAFKNTGGSTWRTPSDAKIKDVQGSFEDGLEKLMKVNPIRYKYNGKMGLSTKEEYVGIIAQELQPIFPYMISSFQGKLEEGDTDPTELLEFDASSLTFVLVNAVKELAKRVKALERLLPSVSHSSFTIPTSASTKKEIQDYLDSNSIRFNKSDSKADLLEILKNLNQL